MTQRYILRLFALGLIACLPAQLRAQQRAAPVRWLAEPAAARLLAASPLAGRLTAYRATTADRATLAAALATAPLEGTAAAPLELLLPLPDGGTARFQVVESSVMEPGLAAQFPNIKTYVGVGMDDPTATLRADLTPQGFHAQVLSRQPGQTFYLDPVSALQPTTCLSYWRRDLRPPAGTTGAGICQGLAPNPAGTPNSAVTPGGGSGGSGARPAISLGTTLRTYRTAVAATGEYTAFHGGTVALGQAAIVTAINRVTGVYEKDLAVRLVLVANNSNVVYTNAATDPYTNGNAGTMINQCQTNIDGVIGNANYDIGHVFGTNSGGLAGLGVVCTAGQKARGVTGSGAPTGDAFWIDYVAHEVGHQFRGNHTFNGSAGSCAGGNRNASTAWEPGSGATIQAYAGICAPQNLQPNSDPYFHGGSIEEMGNFIAGTTCPTSIATGNTIPTISPVANRTIPANTPFRLTASATDANGDPMTYCWEEMDLGAAGAPVTPTTVQTAGSTVPLFRSWLPVTIPTRFFPRLDELRNNTVAVGEALPTVARTLQFRCTVRDTRAVPAAGGILVGGVIQSGMLTLTTVTTAGPFLVTAPNTAVTWAAGSTQTVTWNVANTNVAPVSCATVNIRLSTDGGLTFPTTIVSGVLNNGSASVTVPNSPTTTARMMVEAADNVFFDISNTNFTISNAVPSAPTITSFSPNNGPAGTVVVITGTNLSTVNGVSFNGTTASSFTVNSATQVTATVGAGTTTGTITVTTPAVGSATSGSVFTVTGGLSITSFTPTSGPVGTSVTITGTAFTGATSVTFNGTTAPGFVVNSATQITVSVPTGATTGPIRVTTPSGGTAVSATNFTVTGAPANDLCTAPSLPVLTCGTSVTGTTTGSTSTGDPTTTCTTTIEPASGGVFYRFTGTGGSVTMSTCNAGTTYDTKLFVYSGACAALVCVGGNDDVTCTTATPAGQASTVTFASVAGTSYLVFVSGFNGLRGNFTLSTTCVPAPTITSFTPTSGPVGTSVTITGTAFTGATSVTFNGTTAPGFVVNSATQITATVPAGATTGPIRVTTPSGGTAVSATNFTVTGAPANDQCTAPSLPVLTCGTSATGTTTGSTSTGDPTTTCNATTIQPASGGVFYRFTGTGGSVTMSTCNAGTTYDTKLFVYTGTCAALTCVTGNDDVACATATPANLASSVTFNSVAGTSYLIFVSGFSGLRGNFTLSTTCAPLTTITSFTPTSGPVATTVTVTGTNFTSATSVTFNGTTAPGFVVNSATQITVSVPTGATTGPIRVTTPTGGTAVSATNFTVTVPPANDLCTGTLPVLSCGSSVTGSTTTSTSTGDPTGTCGVVVDPASGGVFYSFTGTGGNVTMSTCNAGTNYDTKLFVYTGTCAALTCVTGNDDVACATATPANRASSVTFNSVAGTSYLIFVSGFSGLRGNFVLSTTCAPPANDQCTGTLPALSCGASVTGSTVVSTSTGDPTVTCTTTIEPASGGVFYRFTGTGGSVTMSTCNAGTNYDTKLFVYTGTCAALTCVTGNDDVACTTATPANRASTVTFASVAGTSYLIFVSGFNGARGTFVLSTTCANVAPTALALAPTSVSENAPVNTTVGTFSSTDPNPGNTFTYTLVAGAGSADNASFNITGNALRTSVVFDFETRSSYSIRVRTTDQGGLSFEQTFTISILDVAEPPVLTSVNPAAELPGAPVALTGTNFSNATGVTFNGQPATFTVVSATQISALVPASATSGPVVVSNPDGPSGGVAFTVYSVYNALTNQCVSATPITSTGTGEWRYLLAGGQVVLAINDQGQALGTITADLIVTTGPPRADVAGNDVVNRSWRLAATTPFGGQAVGVRFYALNTEYTAYQAANDGDPSDVTSLSELRVRQYSGPNEDCLLSNDAVPPVAEVRALAPSTTTPAGVNYFRAEVVVNDHFSEFYLLGANEVTLPVNLTTLRAKRTSSGTVNVTWATASEQANAGWYVERTLLTPDGRTEFAAVSALVAGAGTTAQPRAYAWTDAAAPAGALAYRLRQLDTDGRATRSAIVTVAPAAPGAAPTLALVPNPAHGAVQVSGVPADAPLLLLDAVGRVVRHQPATATGGAEVDLRGLAPGVYTVRAGTATARLVVE